MKFAPGIQALACAALVLLIAVPAQAQDKATDTAAKPELVAPVAQSEPSAQAEPAKTPEQAAQESAAAFDEAAGAGQELAAEGESGSQQQGGMQAGQQKEPETPSYGSFLQRPEKPKSTNIMDTGDSLVASAFSTAAYLCLILGGIFLAYWLLRRFGPHGIAKGRDIVSPQLAGRLMLGQKKHVDVIRVQGKTYLLGVTDHTINLLTEIETQPGQCFDDEDEDEFTDFTEMLGKQVNAGSDTDGD